MQLGAEIIDSDADKEVVNNMSRTLTCGPETGMAKLVCCLVTCSLAKKTCLQS